MNTVNQFSAPAPSCVINSAFAFARSATHDSPEGAKQIEDQLHEIRAYCAAIGLSLQSEPTEIRTMDEIDTLLAAARRGEFRHLVVVSVSRLGRDLKRVYGLMQQFDAAGVTIHFARDGFDTGTAIGRFMFNIFAAQMVR